MLDGFECYLEERAPQEKQAHLRRASEIFETLLRSLSFDTISILTWYDHGGDYEETLEILYELIEARDESGETECHRISHPVESIHEVDRGMDIIHREFGPGIIHGIYKENKEIGVTFESGKDKVLDLSKCIERELIGYSGDEDPSIRIHSQIKQYDLPEPPPLAIKIGEEVIELSNRHWQQVLIECVKYADARGNLSGALPIATTSDKLYVVSTNPMHPDGRRFEQGFELQDRGIWINVKFDRSHHCRYGLLVLRESRIMKPLSVIYCGDGEEPPNHTAFVRKRGD